MSSTACFHLHSPRRGRSPSPSIVHLQHSNPLPMDTLNAHSHSKPLRRCRSASPAPPRGPIMSTERQLYIKRSWQRVPKSQFGNALIMELLSKLGRTTFGDDPDVLVRHQRHFVELIQNAVDNLSDIETALKPWLDLLGKGHAGFKIKSKHWDAFGESLIKCITEWIGPGKTHRETIKAWMVLSSFLSDRLGAASRSSINSPMVTPRLQLMTFIQPQ